MNAGSRTCPDFTTRSTNEKSSCVVLRPTCLMQCPLLPRFPSFPATSWHTRPNVLTAPGAARRSAKVLLPLPGGPTRTSSNARAGDIEAVSEAIPLSHGFCGGKSASVEGRPRVWLELSIEGTTNKCIIGRVGV